MVLNFYGVVQEEPMVSRKERYDDVMLVCQMNKEKIACSVVYGIKSI